MKHSYFYFAASAAGLLLLAALARTAPALATPAATTKNTAPVQANTRAKKIFAHYMGSWPAASGPLVYDFQGAKNLRHDAPDEASRLGGHIRNWSLPSPDAKLSLHDSIDLEIRRALHIGIDGFTVDAWAGGQSAKDSLDMMFTVAEEKNYPFEITVTPDPNSLGGETIVDVIKYLLDKHGKSPKLARRDGKPLIFGYQSIFVVMAYCEDAYNENPELGKTWIWDKPEWRSTPKGFKYMGQAMKTLEKKVGQPLYLQFAMEAMDYGITGGGISDDQKIEAAGILGKYVGGIGAFGYMGPRQNEIAAAVRKSGAEWMHPIGLGQKENIPYESWGAPGLNYFRSAWEGAIAGDTTLMQYITWNDYGENSALAPAFNTRYALFDLTSYYISRWKHGKEPVYDHDKVYLAYHKYPQGAKIFPFASKFPRGEAPKLEVVTILTKPATIRLSGRKEEYAAPAGFFTKQFPNTPGAVIAEVVRGGKVTTHLESPEPITDKPFREDNGYTAFSTEDARHWKSDFGGTPMWTYSEYGDADHDGLPNWFEMYWFGTWMDFSTQTIADPNADPDHDGKTTLQEYLDQSDPTLSPAEEKLVGTLPLSYLKHRARGELVQAGSVQVAFANGSFEQAGNKASEAAGWSFQGTATRTREKASSGQWSMKLTQGSHVAQYLGDGAGYFWNSDALAPYAIRPGCVAGYSVEVAAEKENIPQRGYMRLAQKPDSTGGGMWGGLHYPVGGNVPHVQTSGVKFSSRSIAHLMSQDISTVSTIGGVWVNNTEVGEPSTLYFDDFSPLTIVRPQLKISSTLPIQFGQVAANAAATSATITISNGQAATVPLQLSGGDGITPIATILYGVADFKRDEKGFDQVLAAPTDDVGAVLIGEQVNLFEFVSEHRGDSPQQLKLIGTDGQPGLLGGAKPESEDVVVRFKGSVQPGEYSATLRVVTQAANTGVMSLAKPGEPAFNFFYTDIPVSVTVQ